MNCQKKEGKMRNDSNKRSWTQGFKKPFCRPRSCYGKHRSSRLKLIAFIDYTKTYYQ